MIFRYLANFFFLLPLLICLGCSLDDRYFDPRTTENYSLSTSVIPEGQIEEVSFQSNGETIFGIFVRAATQNSGTKTILYFHGDDKDIAKYWERIEDLYPLGLNIFIFDYQGYGKSTGSPNINSLKRNSRDALTFLKGRSDVNVSKIIYYAFSLGGIFASDLAVNAESPMALITENIPASSDAMVRSSIRVAVPGTFFFNETFDNIENLRSIRTPILIFHSRNDETVPYSGNAPHLFSAANEPKTFVSVENAGHSDLIESMGESNYRNAIANFLSSIGS